MQLHASCVALRGQGILIIGPSGSGKSTLALSLLSIGAILISDDQVCISNANDWPTASAPRSIRGLIEARGVGILAAEAIDSARVRLVIDMEQVELERLPPDRTTKLCGVVLPLLHKVESCHFPAAIRQYVIGGKATC